MEYRTCLYCAEDDLVKTRGCFARSEMFLATALPTGTLRMGSRDRLAEIRNPRAASELDLASSQCLPTRSDGPRLVAVYGGRAHK